MGKGATPRVFRKSAELEERKRVGAEFARGRSEKSGEAEGKKELRGRG